MKMLLVSHPSLTAELGAAQIALHLAAELRALGHDAAAWSPELLPPGTRWWNLWVRQRRAIERYAREHGPFDLIDTPAISASAALAREAPLLVRSLQPELHYLAWAVWGDLRHRLLPSPRALAHALLSLPRAGAIAAGWRRARGILCLGGGELAWMRRRFPGWAGKLGVYVCAPSEAERSALAAVRRQRSAPAHGAGIRFLWMGRWTAHKGTRRLLHFLGGRLASSRDDRFTIAGCGPAAEREVPAEWRHSGRVHLVPSFARSELPALLAAHDAGLFTSSVEGWGLSVSEMLESGLPVYATEAGAVRDLRPWFPASLRPFPPPARIEPAAPEDLEANGYYQRFTWRQIAREYERQVMAFLGAEGSGA
ncbi:MAG TPA: glycosyltransferase family 4 protein [Thermoanaerobaculia bacterium]|nr:glycosyltransferase family 4 protein [Thermoanaerobaculia bacterium]